MSESKSYNLKSPESIFVIGMGLLYAILYLIFLPRCFTILDESAYINTAYVLRQGTFYADVAGIPVVCTYPVHGHYVSKYPPGMAILLALTSFLGWKTTLAVNLAVHLLTYWLVIRLLRRRKIPPAFAVLYLFHPTAVLYSRTVMADLPSGLLLTLAFSAFLNRRAAWCGACLGLAVLMRTANGLALPLFLLACFIPDPASGREPEERPAQIRNAAQMLLGACPFLLFMVYYAQVVAGGQMAQHTGTFALRYVPQNLPLYLAGLLLFYPAMLAAPLLYRGPGRLLIGLLCGGFLGLYSLWYYHDQGSSTLETLIAGQRYFLAILPLFILAYSAVLWRWMERLPARRRAFTALAGTGLLFLFAAAIHIRHAKHVAKYEEARSALLRTVRQEDMLLCNAVLGKLFHPGFGTCRYRILDDPSALQRDVETALSQPDRRVFLAVWIRPGREDDRVEQQAIENFAKDYETHPLSRQERSGLPDEIILTQIVKRSAPEKPVSPQKQANLP